MPAGLRRLSRYPVIGRLCRFLTWWLIFSGIYASSSVCPFCGQAGCPVGAASAGLVGGLFALIISNARAGAARVKGWWARSRAAGSSTPGDQP
jgi:hypothetical protein